MLKNKKAFLFLILINLLLQIIHIYYIDEFSFPAMAFGIISKHTLENDNHSNFDYTPDYSGVTVFGSYLVLPLVLLFGLSLNLIKSFLFILLSSILVILFYTFLNKFFNQRVAVLSTLLFILFTTHLPSPHAHLWGVAFNLILIFIFYTIVYNNKKNGYYIALLGFFSGFGYWIFPTQLIISLTCLIFLYCLDRIFFIKKVLVMFLIFFIIGYSPGIYGEIVQSENFAYFAYEFEDTNLINSLNNLKDFATYKLALALFDEKSKVLSFIAYFITLVAYFTILYRRRHSIRIFLSRLFSIKHNIYDNKIKKETFLLVYPIIFLIAASLVRSGGGGALHHLSPLYILPPIFIALYLDRNWDKKLLLSLMIILYLVFLGVVHDVNSFKEYENGPLETEKKISRITYFLDSIGIKYVYSHSYISLPIVFQSNEQIIVHDPQFEDFMDFDYPKYNRIVENSTDYAFVYYENSSINKKLKLYLDLFNISHQKQRIDDKVVYYSLSKNIRPGKFNTNYIFIKGSMGDQLFKSRVNTKYYELFDFEEGKVVYFLKDVR